MKDRRFGDRRDGRLLRDMDPLHVIMPMIYPDRCDNEAFIKERIDLTAAMEYLDRKNEGETSYRYTFFHLAVAAMVKVMIQRPKMNRFIANRNMYERNEVTAAFVIKMEFDDDGEEGLAFIHGRKDQTIDDIHEEIRKHVTGSRHGDMDKTSDSLAVLNRAPRWIIRLITRLMMIADRHGKVPRAFSDGDPFYASVFLSNLGSIGMDAAYHHLTNWGTNSVFCTIGTMGRKPFLDDEGRIEMREAVDLGLTIDERIADGYYYSRTVRLLKKLLEEPELLERPFGEEIDI